MIDNGKKLSFLHFASCVKMFRAGNVKGIDRPFGGGVESILILSVLLNWKLGYFFYLILKGLLHKISIKPLDAA
jgi:hypothetical protein